MARAPRSRATQLAENILEQEAQEQRKILARTEAEILVLGQIRDSLSEVNKGLAKLNDGQQELAIRMTKLESKTYERDLNRLEDDFETYKIEREKLRKEGFDRITTLELQMARYQGLFMPLAIIGSAALTGTITVVLHNIGVT